MDTKMVTEEEVTKELHNQGELRGKTTRALKGRDLKIFVIVKNGRKSKDCWSKKEFVERDVASSNMDMDEEWDTTTICVIEEDKIAFMVMMGEHVDCKDDWIIDSGCSNHMTDNQSSTIEARWPSEKEVLSDLNNIE